MSKRKFVLNDASATFTRKRQKAPDAKKHSLDSDEDDDYDESKEVMDQNDIEGEEDGISRQDNGVRMTAFNMNEEMEEGHFDKHGHFIWENEKEIRDNWLDNVDWHNIKNEDTYRLDNSPGGLGESSSDSENEEKFDEINVYKKIVVLMKPKETVNKAIRRLGGDNSKLSSVERLKRKKAGTLNTNPDVIKLTEYANLILTKLGNMNVYQETYEEISKKVASKKVEPELDMYSDDFDTKEKEKMDQDKTDDTMDSTEDDAKILKWEFKWDQNKDKIEGPFDTRQMIKWAREGYFKTGVWVRKVGENGNFYSSNRIDFEIYE